MAKNKQCTKCKKQKLFSEFGKHSQGKNGLNSVCKECRKIYGQLHKIEIAKQKRRYYQIHKIEILERRKKYHQTHKIERAKYDRKYRKTIIGYLHICFAGIKHRCTNSKCKRYKDWGGRGIKCLFKNSQEFVDYVVNILKIDPRGLTIDRIDNNGHYEPGNIRFVTRSENNKNKRKHGKRK